MCTEKQQRVLIMGGRDHSSKQVGQDSGHKYNMQQYYKQSI